MSKVSLYLRLFNRNSTLPISAAIVIAERTPNSVSYSNEDLRPFVLSTDGCEQPDWQKIGDAIFVACSTHDAQSIGRIWVGGEYEITWRKT